MLVSVSPPDFGGRSRDPPAAGRRQRRAHWVRRQRRGDCRAERALRVQRVPRPKALPGSVREWSRPEFGDAAALIVSELITNSVLETARYDRAVLPPVRMWLRGGPPGKVTWSLITIP